jgi:hypothetical protein
MTKPSDTDFSDINIAQVLASRRQVAVTWSIEDVQGVRPDLSDDQAWDVLQEAIDKHDAEYGFTWGFIEFMADELFPRK